MNTIKNRIKKLEVEIDADAWFCNCGSGPAWRSVNLTGPNYSQEEAEQMVADAGRSDKVCDRCRKPIKVKLFVVCDHNTNYHSESAFKATFNIVTRREAESV